jgi:hypothetical protein
MASSTGCDVTQYIITYQGRGICWTAGPYRDGLHTVTSRWATEEHTVDEQRRNGDQAHNGVGPADTTSWGGPVREDHERYGLTARALSPDPVAPGARATAPVDGDRTRRPAPGLDDDTPPAGTPAVEPPLWREATRFAPTSPGPTRWKVDGSHTDYRGSHVARPSPPASDPVEVRAVDALPPGATTATARRVAAAPGPGDLPQRVPAEPDVPDVGEIPGPQPPAEAPELARIATRLRRDDVPREAPTEGFDVDAVLEAVREVPGVREASVRPNRTGAHTLRLDLAEDADPVQVSRVVARMLQDRMGLSAAPQYVPRARPTPEGQGAAGSAPGGSGHAGSSRYARDSERPGAPQAEPRSQPLPVTQSGPRVVIDHVQVNVVGLHATVQVQLAAGHRRALGLASGPAIDSYVVRLAAVSAARAIDELMGEPSRADRPSRCFVEHTGVVPFGSTEVAVVVVMLVCGGWVEQLAGSAVVDGDARHAAVRATLGAVNRRLDALLAG